MKRAGAQYRLAIATGGRREQIDHTLCGAAIEQDFAVVVSADNVATGKPDPAIYHATLKRLTAVDPRPPLLTARNVWWWKVPEPASAQESCTRQAGRAGKARHSE